MSRKISAPNIISGTHGKVWWDDSVIYEISSFEATLDTDREDVTFAGDMIKDSKLMSVSGTFTMKEFCGSVYARKRPTFYTD